MNGYLVSVFQICRRRPNRKAAIAWFVVVCSVIFTAIATPAAVLAQTCAEGALPGSPGRFALSVRLENDALGGRGQDQNYTGGTFVTVRSPNLESFTDDPCLPSTIGWLNRTFTWLQPENVDQRNMIFGVAHLAYTPSDRLRTDVIASDRPYASLLLFSLGYNGRNGAQLKATQLRVGWVGPVTQGERVQNWYHDSLGLKRFQGWNNQLRNEVLVQGVHERLYRWSTSGSRQGWGTDFISHWGGALGNLATHANAGAEWRVGWRLPDDFGTASLRPAGDNLAPGGTSARSSGDPAGKVSGWEGHLFASVDVRAVLHDISLDGNTFKSSHNIAKRPWVSDFGFGFAVRAGSWKLVVARNLRTREFSGQKDPSAYGGLTLVRDIP